MRLEGRLEDFNLLDVVQAALRYPSPTRLLVADDDHEGMLQLGGGIISAARWNQLSGEDAVFHLLTHQQGFFSLDDLNGHGVDDGLSLSWPALVQRAFRRAVDCSFEPQAEPTPLNADQRRALSQDLEILFQSLEADAERLGRALTPVDCLLIQSEMLNMAVSLSPEPADPKQLRLADILTRRGWRGANASFVHLDGPLIDLQTLSRHYQAAAFDALSRSRETEDTARMLAAVLDDLLSALIALVENAGESRPLLDRKRSLVRVMITAIDAYNF